MKSDKAPSRRSERPSYAETPLQTPRRNTQAFESRLVSFFRRAANGKALCPPAGITYAIAEHREEHQSGASPAMGLSVGVGG
jgi:hypothetical protein